MKEDVDEGSKELLRRAQGSTEGRAQRVSGLPTRTLPNSFIPIELESKGTRPFRRSLRLIKLCRTPKSADCTTIRSISKRPHEVMWVQRRAQDAIWASFLWAGKQFVRQSVSPYALSRYQLVPDNFSSLRAPDGLRTEELNFEVILTAEEARQGGVIPIEIPVFYPCCACGGSGREWMSPCVQCQGLGGTEIRELLTSASGPGAQSGTVSKLPSEDWALRIVIFDCV